MRGADSPILSRMIRMCLAAAGMGLLMGCAVLLPDFLGSDGVADGEVAGILVLNEVSADNPTEADWVELYNSGSEGIDLSGFGLSDDPAYPTKWRFPYGTGMAGRSHLVVVCDGSGSWLSSSFQLSANVEGLTLTTPTGALLDSLVTVPSTGTGSYGRATDGDATWTVFLTPTKGSSNQ